MDDGDSVEDGRFSRRRRYRKVVRERPGLAPAALFHFIGNSIFLRLSDVASGLPPYEEQVMLCPMDSEPDSYGYTQRGAYGTLYEKLREALAEALARGSRKLLSTYLQSLLAYPDGCTRGERPSSIPTPRTCSSRCRRSPRRSCIQRRKRYSTWWPPSG